MLADFISIAMIRRLFCMAAWRDSQMRRRYQTRFSNSDQGGNFEERMIMDYKGNPYEGRLRSRGSTEELRTCTGLSRQDDGLSISPDLLKRTLNLVLSSRLQCLSRSDSAE
ncbi:hypothetical protein RRG08_030343 [Elysia crispata]|uniref:Uncharacterized protein n=1 Tax=Elysia crispata TaxID=231223 RepID=A0AAE1CZB9_9GAST|nr:hypothetical protein RRG08_030343 [Elysia crispata]